jgi:hypothetical protein
LPQVEHSLQVVVCVLAGLPTKAAVEVSLAHVLPQLIHCVEPHVTELAVLVSLLLVLVQALEGPGAQL